MAERPKVVLVPDQRGVVALGDVDLLTPLLYEPGGSRFPDGAVDAVAIVVDDRDPDEVLTKLEQLPQLGLVQLLTSGYDAWRGRLPSALMLANARGAHGAAVAEWVLAQTLGWARQLPHWRELQSRNEWSPASSRGIQGLHVGVVGAGDIGVRTADLFRAFEATVDLVGRSSRPGVRSLTEFIAGRGAYDVVVLALPLTASTEHLVDDDFLGGMRDGSVVINVARGGVVDTEALIRHAASGRVEAILDVVEGEPLTRDSALWSTPGVTITPHVGSWTDGIDDRIWAVAAKQVQQFITGGRPDNMIDDADLAAGAAL